MLRILGKISIYGTQAGLERLASVAPILDGAIKQVGNSRKVPEIDSWCYASPWYRFRIDTMDEEVRNFLDTNAQLGKVLNSSDTGIEYAVISLCPVGQNEQETFACLFSHETLDVLASIGFALEIAPASVLPNAPYWIFVRK